MFKELEQSLLDTVELMNQLKQDRSLENYKLLHKQFKTTKEYLNEIDKEIEQYIGWRENVDKQFKEHPDKTIRMFSPTWVINHLNPDGTIKE